MRKLLPTLALLALASLAPSAHAQAVDAEKQKQIDRLIAVSHLDEPVVMIVQKKAVDAIQQSRAALQGRVTQEKMDKTMKDISTDVQKYIDTASPIAAASAKKSVAPAVTQLLAQNFTADEIRQIVAIIESPVMAKYNKVMPELNKAVFDKVQADVGPAISAKMDEMTKAVGTKLRAAASVN